MTDFRNYILYQMRTLKSIGKFFYRKYCTVSRSETFSENAIALYIPNEQKVKASSTIVVAYEKTKNREREKRSRITAAYIIYDDGKRNRYA